LVERQGLRELHTMRRWAEALPVAALEAHPAVSFYQAMATLFTGDRYAPATAAALEAPLRRAQTAWEREANTPQLGRVAALRAVILGWQGEARQAHAAAQEALAQLPEDDVYWRSIGLLTLGIEELQEGRVNTAQSLLIEARALCGASGNEHGRLAATTALAEVAYWQGEFDLARQFYQQVLAEAVGGEEMLDDQGAARLGLSLVAYEQGDLAEAEPLAVEAMVLGQRRHDEDLEARAAVQLARVHQARGQGARGRALLQGLAARLRRRDPLRRLRAGEASLALSAGDGGAAGAGQVGRGDEAEAATRVGQEAEAAVQARLHLAQGQPEAALTLLAPWQTDAHTHGRLRSEIAWLGLRALALASTGDAEGAEAALERALALARPKGFRRALADEGAAMAALLQALGPRLGKRALAAYAAGLLREMGLPRATRGEGVGLGEALSPQEMRVLRLLAAGRSNPEIARELVVSTNTVKTQVQSIFRKLNVTSREAAAEAAREMKLL
jgi:LuxR family maltose regulon positive regulatory protein